MVVAIQRLVEAAQLRQRIAQAGVRDRLLGPQGERTPDEFGALGWTPRLSEHDTQQMQGVGLIGLEAHPLEIGHFGLREASEPMTLHRLLERPFERGQHGRPYGPFFFAARSARARARYSSTKFSIRVRAIFVNGSAVPTLVNTPMCSYRSRIWLFTSKSPRLSSAHLSKATERSLRSFCNLARSASTSLRFIAISRKRATSSVVRCLSCSRLFSAASLPAVNCANWTLEPPARDFNASRSFFTAASSPLAVSRSFFICVACACSAVFSAAS